MQITTTLKQTIFNAFMEYVNSCCVVNILYVGSFKFYLLPYSIEEANAILHNTL